jgi:hypothetical protein
MKKELALALPLALAMPYASANTVTVTGTGGTAVCGTNQGCTNSLSNLRDNASITLQTSDGVQLAAQDGGTGTSWGANDIAVSSCHDGGRSAFYGDTGGGSIEKNANYGTGTCSNNTISYTSASNS